MTGIQQSRVFQSQTLPTTATHSKFNNNRSNGTSLPIATAPSHEADALRTARDNKLVADKTKKLQRKQAKAFQKQKALFCVNKARKQGNVYCPTPKIPFVAAFEPKPVKKTEDDDLLEPNENAEQLPVELLSKLLRVRSLKKQANRERRKFLKLESRKHTRTQGDGDIFSLKVSTKQLASVY